MLYTPLANKALRIAYDAHAGQYDSCNIPYIFHPLHLAEQMEDEVTTCTALLHDVVEDTQITFEDLEKDFPKEVMDALRLLTHDFQTDYFDYVRKIRTNPVAKAVKLADLAHNSDESRYAGCDGVSVDQLEWYRWKYTKARKILEEE